MDKDRIKNFMRGHLISIKGEPIILKKFGDEFFKTRYWDVIIGNSFVSFKHNRVMHRINFADIKKFFLKDSCTFVIDVAKPNPKKRFYFKIVK